MIIPTNVQEVHRKRRSLQGHGRGHHARGPRGRRRRGARRVVGHHDPGDQEGMTPSWKSDGMKNLEDRGIMGG